MNRFFAKGDSLQKIPSKIAFFFKERHLCNKVKSTSGKQLYYAGMLRRMAALSIDLAILMFLFVITWLLLLPLSRFVSAESFSILVVSLIFPTTWLYFALLESSRFRGTWGKRILAIEVVDLEGDTISFKKASLCFITKLLLSCLWLVNIYFLLFHQRKQTLSDQILSICVIRNSQP